MKILLNAALAAACLSVITAAASPSVELQTYKKRVQLLQDLINIECGAEAKRQVDAADVETQKALYNKLRAQLRGCWDKRVNQNSLPAECRSATNLTEAWRLDYSAQDIKPGGPHSNKGTRRPSSKGKSNNYTGEDGFTPSHLVVITQNVCQ